MFTSSEPVLRTAAIIDLPQAKEMIKAFKNTYPQINTRAVLFIRKDIEAVLGLAKAEIDTSILSDEEKKSQIVVFEKMEKAILQVPFVRFYYALKPADKFPFTESPKVTLIMVGVISTPDGKYKDITDEAEGISMFDFAMPCPPFTCDENSELTRGN